ncbi:MAG: SWIM zinc finger family protein [Thermoproteota archaeon]|nr:SWIM zinc finger family protein [Thermoproteota archaeon]
MRAKKIDKINKAIEGNNITKIVFMPSEEELWEIKSSKSIDNSNNSNNNNIYFVDLINNYCSCKGFYYNFKVQLCYHLIAVKQSKEKFNYNTKILDDRETEKYFEKLLENILMK